MILLSFSMLISCLVFSHCQSAINNQSCCDQQPASGTASCPLRHPGRWLRLPLLTALVNRNMVDITVPLLPIKLRVNYFNSSFTPSTALTAVNLTPLGTAHTGHRMQPMYHQEQNAVIKHALILLCMYWAQGPLIQTPDPRGGMLSCTRYET